ncbi:hypothetical protein amb2728 [Paramagnetospirillum magneticum AMB-1]|uniref:Uncharacterized protein n=1 Tax=Paramagnetospirillum magneticum (strain ATCC 700264 / AMB-1) TaxID=342108 RepID=Q2W3P2_PARM1|nr:hypothetical protein amb2728 [Paramagnetospirillum magneticum AMB-1]
MIADSVHAKALRLATSSLNFGLFRMCSALARFAADGLPCELINAPPLTLHGLPPRFPAGFVGRPAPVS